MQIANHIPITRTHPTLTRLSTGHDHLLRALASLLLAVASVIAIAQVQAFMMFMVSYVLRGFATT
jgi:hypothetical protein